VSDFNHYRESRVRFWRVVTIGRGGRSSWRTDPTPYENLRDG